MLWISFFKASLKFPFSSEYVLPYIVYLLLVSDDIVFFSVKSINIELQCSMTHAWKVSLAL